jgi:FMN reductase
MTVAIVVGNPKAGSRTLRVAESVGSAINGFTDTPSDVLIVDLADIAAELFDFDSVKVKEILLAVASSDVVIVASPTYKATYTGLLKSFLDRYQNDALAHTLCIPVMTGAAPIHALAPEVYLRPLLVELGASVPTRGLYVTEQQFDDLDDVIAKWLMTAGPLLARTLAGSN